MRGKQFLPFFNFVHFRITPADAGKTRCATNSAFASRDHPRGCGENPISVADVADYIGSPPRMRGKHLVHHRILCLTRITPADAGKTSTAWIPTKKLQDHPRGCGENI